MRARVANSRNLHPTTARRHRACGLTAVLMVGAMAVAAAPAQAQGTVTDGDASFSYITDFNNATCAKRVTFVPGTVGGAVGVAWQDWWWLGVGGAAEAQLPPPTTQTYVGATATLTFTNLGGVGGLAATLIGRVENGAGDNQASWYEQLTITNGSASTVSLDVLQYADIEVGGTFANDAATLPAPADPSWIRITDTVVAGTFQDHRARQPSGHRAGIFSGVCAALNNAVADDFTNTGLPFSGDYTAGFEWRSQSLAPGASARFDTAIGIGEPASPGGLLVDGFETGSPGAWSAAVN